jgi:Nif-specific regulatory protein
MPPLRERREDIPNLAAHFAAKYARGRAVEFAPDALQALTGHDWPGNVRELENAIERAVVLGSSDRITAEDLPDILLEPAEDAESGAGAAFHDGVRETKRRLILDAIDRSGGNYAAAARLLGLNPTYLHRLLKNLQIKDVAARR